MIPLTASDRKILSALSLNARASLSEVAKTTGVSRQVVKYTLDKLENQGVIEGYYAVLNIDRLGYTYYRLYFRLQNVSPAREKAMVSYFRGHKDVGWVCRVEGNWDLCVAVWTRNLLEFEAVLDEILHRFGSEIDEKVICTSMRIHHFRHKYLTGDVDGTALVFDGGDTVDVDETDRAILGILAQTARKTYNEMGEELSISPKVVQYRMAKLESQGVILGFNIKLNTRLLGLMHHKVFLQFVNITRDAVATLIRYLTERPETVYITKAIGIADLEFEVVVPDSDAFHAVLRDVRQRFPKLIKGVTSHIIAEEPLINYLPQLKKA